MDGGPQFELDCPRPEQLWPVYAGPGPGHPVVGYFKHGDSVNAKPGADGWLELQHRRGWVKARDPGRAQFLKTQQHGYEQPDDAPAHEDDCALFGWHEVLVAPGLQAVPVSQLAARQLSWCDACGERLMECRTGHAMTLGCGHAFHPACLARWPSASICYACRLKCTPAPHPASALAAPKPPPVATLHFSALPPAIHHRLLLTLLVLLSLALLKHNHALLRAAAARTLLPLLRLLLLRLPVTAFRALCRLPGQALRLPGQALRLLSSLFRLLCWLLSSTLRLPATLLRAAYHTPAALLRARLLPRALLGRSKGVAKHALRRLASVAAATWHQRHPLVHPLRGACGAVLSSWGGYRRWLEQAARRQLWPVLRLVPWQQLPPELLADLREAWAAAAGQWELAAVQLLMAAERWVERSPWVAVVLGKCQEWVAPWWGPGWTFASSVALLAVVGLSVAGHKVRV